MGSFPACKVLNLSFPSKLPAGTPVRTSSDCCQLASGFSPAYASSITQQRHVNGEPTPVPVGSPWQDRPGVGWAAPGSQAALGWLRAPNLIRTLGPGLVGCWATCSCKPRGCPCRRSQIPKCGTSQFFMMFSFSHSGREGRVLQNGGQSNQPETKRPLLRNVLAAGVGEEGY